MQSLVLGFVSFDSLGQHVFAHLHLVAIYILHLEFSLMLTQPHTCVCLGSILQPQCALAFDTLFIFSSILHLPCQLLQL